jgi:copper chaperone CopZ
MKSNNKLAGLGLLTALTASLCCITPVLAILAGTSGLASTFSWVEPLRPYLIGLTVLVLGFAWYQKLKPGKPIDCDCEEDEQPKFIDTKPFLGIVTGFTVLMLAFPWYSSAFYPEIEKESYYIDESNVRKVEFLISGMTCNSCEDHVNHEVNKLEGIVSLSTSYDNGNAIITFDKVKLSAEVIEEAINSTGYIVTNKKEN